MKSTQLLLLIISLSGCASIGPPASPSLIGKWLGQSSVQDAVRCWVNHRRADGTYELTFLLDSASAPQRHVEEGLWLYSHGIYATITQRMNGKPVDLRDKHFREFYRAEVLDERQFTYAEIATGARFRVVKVPDSFVLGNKCPSGT